MGNYSEFDLPAAIKLTRIVFLYGISRGHVHDGPSLAVYVKALEDADVPLVVQWNGDGNEALKDLREGGFIAALPAPPSLLPKGEQLVKQYEQTLSEKIDKVPGLSG